MWQQEQKKNHKGTKMKKFVAILTASMLLASSMNMGEAYSMGLNGVYMDVTATDTDALDVSTTETT